ncbi:hypothetical protein BDF22DRAFT_691348 [Syncephalis plumigaleata]|nr:hypothetical protein BDF22DRAFT_691348 [Syncephalis plumigaleata]
MLLKLVFIAFAFVATVAAYPTSKPLSRQNTGLNVKPSLYRRQNLVDAYSWELDDDSLGSAIQIISHQKISSFYNILVGFFKSSPNGVHPLNVHNAIAFVPIISSNSYSIRTTEQLRYHMVSGTESPFKIPPNGQGVIYSYNGLPIYVRRRGDTLYINCSKVLSQSSYRGNTIFTIDRVLDPASKQFNEASMNKCP